jgi:hypothetical protein
MDTEHLMDTQDEPVRVPVEQPPSDLETVVVAVNAADLEADLDATIRWAMLEAGAQAFAQGLALEPGHRTAVTHHELADGFMSPPHRWFQSLTAAGHELIDLSFVVFTARLEAPE